MLNIASKSSDSVYAFKNILKVNNTVNSVISMLNSSVPAPSTTQI